MDDKKALPFTLGQTKVTGELHFQVGVAIVPRTELDRVKKKYQGHLHYERAELEANSYHGNVLLKGGIAKHLMGQIRALLADSAQVMRRDDNE